MGCYIALCISAVSLLGAGLEPGLIAVFVIFQGAGFGVFSIMKPVVTAELLGRRNFGVVSGLTAIAYVGGAAIGPTVASELWRSGGYDLVIMAALAAAGLGLLSLAAAWRSAERRID